MKYGLPTTAHPDNPAAFYINNLYHEYFFGPFLSEEEVVAALNTLDEVDPLWDYDPFRLLCGANPLPSDYTCGFPDVPEDVKQRILYQRTSTEIRKDSELAFTEKDAAELLDKSLTPWANRVDAILPAPLAMEELHTKWADTEIGLRNAKVDIISLRTRLSVLENIMKEKKTFPDPLADERWKATLQSMAQYREDVKARVYADACKMSAPPLPYPEPGVYWVKLKHQFSWVPGDPFTTSHCTDPGIIRWFILGYPDSVSSEEIAEIGPRVLPPEEEQ